MATRNHEEELEFELEGEFEGEMEGEFELEGEGEFEGEEFLGTIARGIGSLLGGQVEGEFEYEGEFEGEFEMEAEGPLSQQEAMAEYMAAVAARAQSEAEAEAMIGAATANIISRADRRALRAIVPNLTRGAAILTRILRRRRITRPAVRAMATQTRRVLSSPRTCAQAITRNVRATAAAARTQRRPAARRTAPPV